MSEETTITDAPDNKILAVIQNNLEVLCSTPVEIIPNHMLRRPSEPELERVRDLFRTWGGPIDPTLAYESTYQSADKMRTHSRSGDPKVWRYWVIEATIVPGGSLNNGLLEIEEASRLTSVELRCQTILYPSGGVSFGGQIGDNSFGFKTFPEVEKLDDSTVRQIADARQGLLNIAGTFPSLRRSVMRYRQLSAIAREQPLYLLGVFAVIESVLTHDPHGDYDSLGHQIKAKMQLLNHRFDAPLDCSSFKGLDFGKLWSKFYSLRSCIAHGGDTDFTKELKSLVDLNTATAFIENAAKAVLRHALKEPELIIDLQRC